MTTATGTAARPRSPRFTGSDLATLHSSTGPMRDALEEQPAWTAARDQLAALEDLGRVNAPTTASPVQLVAHLIADAITRGVQLDLADVIAAVRQDQDQRLAAEVVGPAINTLRGQLLADLDNALRSDEARLYAAVSHDLERIIGAAREHADLIGTDPRSVIRAGKADQLAALDQLREAYVARRQDFARLTHRLSWNPTRTYGDLTWLRNPAEAWPGWIAREAARHSTDPTEQRAAVTSPPWADRAAGHGTPPDAAHQFHWLVQTPTAIPWAPTARQADRVAADLAEQVREASTPQRRNSAARRIGA